MTLGLIIFYIALVILRPQEYIQSMENAPILSSVFMVTFVAWILSVKKDFSVPQPFLITSFFIVALVSVVASGWAGGAWLSAQSILPGWGIFMMLSMTAITASRIKLVLDVITICAFVIAVHSIEQYFTGMGWTGLPLETLDNRVRYLGIFHDPNDLGTLLVSTIPVVIHWFGRESSGMLKMVYLIMLGTLITAIYLTDSRGVLLATGVILIFELSKRIGKVKAGLLGLIAAVLGAAYTRLSELSVDEASASDRIEAWYAGLEMFKQYPILGVGFDNFTEHHPLTAHNSFLLVLAETGIIGFYFWFSLITITLIILINFLRKSKEDLNLGDNSTNLAIWTDYRSLTWTYLISLLAYLTSIAFLSRSYDAYFLILFAIGSGLCLALQKRYQVVPNLRVVNKMGGWAVTAVAGAAFIYVSVMMLLKLQS